MQFQRLRLSGFKSFVEPAEFRIEPGLTGVVGPNGCGKSNLLEALRWVMGASSAKAMRAGGMDEVIFGGAGSRPARNHAEVTLTIDNADRTAPPAWNDAPVLEVTRRIDRGSGSTYRVNGREARARDIQLLFADAATGANSPALVRQGQISELIAAKPQNRRRILEEAAGVGGLHARRHEAELRLRAAEANLERLDDVARELETGLARAKREARAAERYKRLSAEIRALQGAVLHARWAEAMATLAQANEAAAAAVRLVGETVGAAGAATAAALTAAEALTPLREEEVVAAAVLQRAVLEKDRLDRALAEAREAEARARAEVARVAADSDRERALEADAAKTLRRLSSDLSAVEAEIAAAPRRTPELEATAAQAEARRAAADAGVERLAAEQAAAAATWRAAQQRVAEAESRASRAVQALAGVERERAGLGSMEDPRQAVVAGRLADAIGALAAARDGLTAAEAGRAGAATAEAAARETARALDDRLGRLRAEARGLAQLAAPARGQVHSPALDSVSAARGYEAALAAALGEDLSAALDPAAAAHWAGAEAILPIWPEGVEPLAAHVSAPAALAARLAHVGVVIRADGERLRAGLPVGARLVSHEGDLWRWDGFTARAEAPRPAAVRLEQRARQAELEAEIDRLAPEAAAAAGEHAASRAALGAAEAAVTLARQAPPNAERALTAAQSAAETLTREAAKREARAAALDEALARLTADRDAAEAALAAARAELPTAPAAEGAATLASARAEADRARAAAAAARSAVESERRDADARARRQGGLTRDHADWSRRAAGAVSRLTDLEHAATRARTALEAARAAPEAATHEAARVEAELAVAERRRNAAAANYAAADHARVEAEREARAADARAASAREARAAADARAEGAVARAAETAEAIRDALRLEPEALARQLAASAVAIPSGAGGAEQHLHALSRERDGLGAVNLMAEEQACEQAARLEAMRRDRADLTGALTRLRGSIRELNAEGAERLLAAFAVVDGHFQSLFRTLFDGGEASLKLIESEDPLEAGLEIYACPPGKRMATMSLMSGGEQALTATALIFAVFLAAPAPVCVLDEVDAPLDDANVDRFCDLLDEMRRRAATRFICITHNAVTMSRMDRLFGVTMGERGVSQLVSVDLRQAEVLVAA